MLSDIKSELHRVGAAEVAVSLDREFEPEAGELVNIELNDAYWHMLPAHFLELLKDLPDAAGSEAIRTAIEKKGMFVWHGPAPKGERDDAP